MGNVYTVDSGSYRNRSEQRVEKPVPECECRCDENFISRRKYYKNYAFHDQFPELNCRPNCGERGGDGRIERWHSEHNKNNADTRRQGHFNPDSEVGQSGLQLPRSRHNYYFNPSTNTVRGFEPYNPFKPACNQQRGVLYPSSNYRGRYPHSEAGFSNAYNNGRPQTVPPPASDHLYSPENKHGYRPTSAFTPYQDHFNDSDQQRHPTEADTAVSIESVEMLYSSGNHTHGSTSPFLIQTEVEAIPAPEENPNGSTTEEPHAIPTDFQFSDHTETETTAMIPDFGQFSTAEYEAAILQNIDGAPNFPEPFQPENMNGRINDGGVPQAFQVSAPSTFQQNLAEKPPVDYTPRYFFPHQESIAHPGSEYSHKGMPLPSDTERPASAASLKGTRSHPEYYQRKYPMDVEEASYPHPVNQPISLNPIDADVVNNPINASHDETTQAQNAETGTLTDDPRYPTIPAAGVFGYQVQKLQADHEDGGSQPNAVNPNPDFRSNTSMTNQPDNADTATMPERMKITAADTQSHLPILAPESSPNKIHMFTGEQMPETSNGSDQTSGTVHAKKEVPHELDHYGSWNESAKPDWYTLGLMDDYEAVDNEYQGPEILLHPIEAYTSHNFYQQSTGASYTSNDHEPTSTFSSLFEPPDSISKHVLTDSEVADAETGITSSGEDAGIHDGISGGPNILETKQQLRTKKKSEEHLDVPSIKKEGGVSQENESQVVNTSDNKEQNTVTKKNEQQARISPNNKENEQRVVSTKNVDSVVLPSEKKGQRPGTAASAKDAGESVEIHKRATAHIHLPPTGHSGVQVKAEQRDSSSKTNNSAPGRLSKELSTVLLNALDSSAQLLMHDIKPRTVFFENSQEAPSNTPNLESPIQLSSVNTPAEGSSHDVSQRVSPTRLSGTLRSDRDQHLAPSEYYESGVKKRDPNNQKSSRGFASTAVGGTYNNLQPSGDASLENPGGSSSGKPHVHLIDAGNGNSGSVDMGTTPSDDPQAVVRHGTSADSCCYPWWYLPTPCLPGNMWFALFGGMTILFFICQCRRCNCQPSLNPKAIIPRRCGCP